MTSSLGAFSDSQAGSFDRFEFNGLTLCCCEESRRSAAFFVDGIFFHLDYGLWTVGIEDDLVLFFDGLEMRE
jgi:hypothetical protein